MALEKNLQKIEKLLSLMDSDSLTKEDFINSFQKVVDFVLKNQEQMKQAIDSLEKTYAQLLSKMDNDHSSHYQELKKQTNELFVGDQLKRMEGETKASFEKRQKEINELVDKKLQEADYKVSQLKPIKGDKGDIGDTGPMPTEHLDLMKQMMAELKKAQDILSNLPRGRAMGRAKVPITRFIDLTDQVNGSATTFTLPPDTVRVHGVLSTQFPQIWNTTDWSFSGRTLTLNFTLQSGQSLVVITESLFYP